MLRIISGKFKGHYIQTLRKLPYRPITSYLREAFFNFLSDKVKNSYFMDGFAGTGIIGIEALSRGAKLVFFIEKDKLAISKIKENIKSINSTSNCLFFCKPIEKAIQLFAEEYHFHIIFLDPPFAYNRQKLEKLIKNAVQSNLLIEGGILAVRYERYFGKINVNSEEFKLIKEFINAESYLDVYKWH